MNAKRKAQSEMIEKKQEEQMHYQRKMDEDNMLAEVNMRNSRVKDVGGELEQLEKAAPNLTDEVEIAVNKSLLVKVR